MSGVSCRCADAKGLRDGWQDERGVANGGQRDERDPIGERIANVNRDLKSKTGLPNTTRASQGEQRDVLVKQRDRTTVNSRCRPMSGLRGLAEETGSRKTVQRPYQFCSDPRMNA